MAAPKVLIIEDEHALQTVMRDRFEEEGFDVMEALDGQEGIHKVEQWEPDVIILDILMPRYDGFHVLDQLRRKVHHDVPIYVLTNLADAPSLNRIKDDLADCDHCYVKTDKSLTEVIAEIKQILE